MGRGRAFPSRTLSLREDFWDRSRYNIRGDRQAVPTLDPVFSGGGVTR
ncbi:MAG: hypothetical protein M1537_00200 [Nitrospirae bacterium]|nr:hypothetical protein [Nitrospirota bacterium]MCL5284390.1 hypothetical protein [Nitrospirota bacterium]